MQNVIDSPIRRFIAVALVATATGLYGCASSDTNQTAAINSCQGLDQQACAASDNARQIRDEVDYQQEPSLGYLSSPQGLLPIPVATRNSPN